MVLNAARNEATAYAGTAIEEAIIETALLARRNGHPIRLRFNGHTLILRPESWQSLGAFLVKYDCH